MPRRFALVRQADPSGVSGTGVVAYGVQFNDAHVVVRWNSDSPSTSLWNSIEDLLAVHGHGGMTTVRWLDDEPADLGHQRFSRTVSPDALDPRHRDSSRHSGRHRAP